MVRVLGIIALMMGIILLGFGLNSTQAVSEKVVEGVFGRYTENTMWYILTGSAMVIGGFFAIRSSKSKE